MLKPISEKSKTFEILVEDDIQDRKSSLESSPILQMSTQIIDSDPKVDENLKQYVTNGKSQKKILEELEEYEKSTNEKEKKSLSKSKEQNQKPTNVKVEENSPGLQTKKKRGRPKKVENSGNEEISENQKPRKKKKVSLVPPQNTKSNIPKDKIIKIEGTITLDLTLLLG